MYYDDDLDLVAAKSPTALESMQHELDVHLLNETQAALVSNHHVYYDAALDFVADETPTALESFQHELDAHLLDETQVALVSIHHVYYDAVLYLVAAKLQQLWSQFITCSTMLLSILLLLKLQPLWSQFITCLTMLLSILLLPKPNRSGVNAARALRSPSRRNSSCSGVNSA
jgi:hypothetical protein